MHFSNAALKHCWRLQPLFNQYQDWLIKFLLKYSIWLLSISNWYHKCSASERHWKNALRLCITSLTLMVPDKSESQRIFRLINRHWWIDWEMHFNRRLVPNYKRKNFWNRNYQHMSDTHKKQYVFYFRPWKGSQCRKIILPIYTSPQTPICIMLKPV